MSERSSLLSLSSSLNTSGRLTAGWRGRRTVLWRVRGWALVAPPLNPGVLQAERSGRGLMLKFVVVLYRKPDLPVERFRSILRGEHGALAERLPGLRKYVQNHVAPDATRNHPGWDAVVELYWDDRASMEAAWATPQGQRATEHLSEFVDLSRSTWSIVEEEVRR